MNRFLSTALIAGAAVLFAASAASAAMVNAGANANVNAGVRAGGANVDARQHTMVGAHAAVPRGFHEGRKVGWHGRSTPPGWSHGRKTGWHHAGTPPGLRRH